VVFPDWRGPATTTIRLRDSACRSESRRSDRLITPNYIMKI
jgi:hypothetical protein